MRVDGRGAATQLAEEELPNGPVLGGGRSRREMTHRRGRRRAVGPVDKVVLGIDPGLDGAVALLTPERIEVWITPTIPTDRGGKRRLDASGMAALLTGRSIDLAVIEAVGPRPGQGVTSMFGFGRGLGIWEGILAALRIPFEAVTPQLWKAQILAGTSKDKGAAIEYASRRFPDVELRATARSRTPHDGIADALCLAEFGRQRIFGEGVGEA